MRGGRTRNASFVFLALASLPSGMQGRKFSDHGIHGRRRSLQADDGGLGDVPVSPKPTGDASCPCLSSDALAARFPPVPLNENSIDRYLGSNVNIDRYGWGCQPHDLNTTQCSSGDVGCATIVPLPPDCDKSSCPRSFCYVDPSNCSLLNKPSFIFHDRHFSYAACGFMDSFTYTERLSSLRGKTFKVALNSNTGGWKGAYHPEGHFATDERWEGPIVNFVRNAALEGGFSLNVTSPPDFLRVESEKYFGKSSFDYCVYATALGYVDLCVAAYTVTDKRGSVTSFFEASDDAIFLIVFEQEGGATWESFITAFLTIFQPFTLGTWLMIFLFCLPVMGLLMFYHEYGAPGGGYPRTVPVALQDVATRRVKECTAQKVPVAKNIAFSVYMSFLAFFQESYDQSVVSLGGKLNIIGISSFIMLVLAVYTANLAAILTTDITKTSVANIQEAVAAGYNFCSERKVGQAVIDLHNIDPSLVVPDPIDLGGDGKPGFNCPKCNARQRVFDYMRRTHSDGSLYCKAAFASWEDLQVLHQSSEHCDKTKVGDVLAFQNTGVPLFDGEGVSGPLLALFHRMKNDGKMDKELSAAEPENQCPVQEGEGHSLTVEQLTGIWVITFALAVAALFARMFQRCHMRRKLEAAPGTRVRRLQRYDQWGNPTDHDIFINGKLFDPDSVKSQIHRTESTKRLMASMDKESKDAESENSDEFFEDEKR